VSRLLAKKKPAGPCRLALALRRVDAAREEETLWSLKSCAAPALECTALIIKSTRHVGAAPLELQYREPGPENAVCAIGWERQRQADGRKELSLQV